MFHKYLYVSYENKWFFFLLEPQWLPTHILLLPCILFILSLGSSYSTATESSLGFPCGLVVKNLPPKAGDAGSIPGWGTGPAHHNEELIQTKF